MQSIDNLLSVPTPAKARSTPQKKKGKRAKNDQGDTDSDARDSLSQGGKIGVQALIGLSKTDDAPASDEMEDEKTVSEETLLALKRAMAGRQEKSSEAKAIDAAVEKEEDGREKSRARAIFEEHFAASIFGDCVFLVGKDVPRDIEAAIRSRGGVVTFSASELSKLKYAERKLLFLGDSGEKGYC